MSEIIDTNHDTTRHLSALKAAGIKTVIRYLSPINPLGEKCVKPAEAQRNRCGRLAARAGLRGLGRLCARRHFRRRRRARRRMVREYAASVGAPAGACIYFAVDTDASAAQIRKLVLPYFSAITAAFAEADAPYRRGVYGSGDVCEAALAASLADLSWLSCSMGWGGSRAYLAANTWSLRQHVPATFCGLDADADEANGDFGDFVPFAPAPQSAAAA